MVVSGTNAWVLQVAGDARLDLAREALAEGFRLVSFDDTSLSFIHRPTYPWKQLYLGAGIGGGLVSLGVGLGYLIWGRNPPTFVSQRMPSKHHSAIKQPQSVKTSKPKAAVAPKTLTSKVRKTLKSLKKK